MPFKETCRMEERVALFQAYDTGAFSVSELADRFGVSRETIYVWKRRRESGDPAWFEERSRAPGHCPHATGEAGITAVVAMRQRYPHFGPKKIRAMLAREHPRIVWPAASTIGDILKREGLVRDRRCRRRPLAQGDIIAGADTVNGEWAIDFKGWFRAADGQRCDPLTLSDTASRYLLETRIVEPTWAGVRCALEDVFSAVGLPDAIRSDNGTPFGSTGAGGLSSLAVWWLKLGIEPRYIPPSSPQDNGRHERMHRTLKAETSRPPACNIVEQQRRFDAFRTHYNDVRPHEALGQVTPASLWHRPMRKLPDRLEEPWYDADHEVRRVHTRGQIKWRGTYIFIAEPLIGEPVGIAPLDNSHYIVRFCGRDLGTIDRANRFRSFAPPRARLRSAPEPGNK